MRLSRRDALAALAGLGTVGAVGGAAVLAGRSPPVAGDEVTPDSAEDIPPSFDDAVTTLTAVAEVVYPSTVEGHREFVETYVLGRIEGREEYRRALVAAVAELDAVARDWHDTTFDRLGRETRDRLLRDLGVDVADPDPEGAISARLRYYVVNDLLYAFYTSPTGGRLVGTENPTGYPGGIESYQRGPEALDDG